MTTGKSNQEKMAEYIKSLEQENKSLIEENKTLKFLVTQLERRLRVDNKEDLDDYFEKTKTLTHRFLTNYNGLSEKYRLLNNKIESLHQRVGELEILKELKELKIT